MKTEPQGCPLVTNTIQLLKHRRALDRYGWIVTVYIVHCTMYISPTTARLLDTVDTYKQAIASGELDKMPPLAPAPPMPEVHPFHR